METPTFSTLRDRLLDHGQVHLLQFWSELSHKQQEELSRQIMGLDLDVISRLSSRGPQHAEITDAIKRAAPPPAIRLNGESAFVTAEEAQRSGEEALRDGRVAAVLVAGGQGSRLGFPHPKGMYPLGPLSHRTLFQIHADRLLAVGRRYGRVPPWLIMTSPATDAETREYFETEDYLGYEPRQIALFCQGTMPAIDAQNGKILLESKHQLFASPDGHGGLLAAMAKANLFDSLANDGVDILFYFQVDNPLVAIADPAFLGYHLLAGSEMTTQVVAKRDPLERVGNLVAIDGKLRVIEYSDLPDSAAERRTPSGELEIWAGSIAVHVFSLDFLERMSRSSDSLPFHRALKSVPFMNAMGQLETPATPNAIKFERFIFDILPHANNALVVEVDPAQGFAPVKNLHGVDSPDTARSAMVEQHRKWLRAAGAVVANDVCVEVHPGYAWDVKQLRDQIPDRFVVEHDTYFSPEGRGIE